MEAKAAHEDEEETIKWERKIKGAWRMEKEVGKTNEGVEKMKEMLTKVEKQK